MEIVVMMTSTNVHPAWLTNVLLDSNHIQQTCFWPQMLHLLDTTDQP